MRNTTRDRLVLPLLLPLGILVLMFGALWGFSRILLSLSASAATATALIVAIGILVVAGVVTARGTVRASSVLWMTGAVVGIVMLAGGIALATIGPEKAEEPTGGPAVTVSVAAKDLAFDPTTLSVPAGESFAITFDNQDAGVQHNVVIYDNPQHSGDPVFRGELITGPAEVTYVVPALDAGTYHFNCEVHPTMTGTIEVGAAAGGGGGAGVTVVAQGIAFDTDTIELPADQPTTITFDNQDPGVQHNISIYQDDSRSKVLFQGEIITGAATATYQVPPLPPGRYYFQCDVHPNMNGTVVVGGKGGDGGGGGGPSASASATPTPAESPSGGGGGGVTVTAQGLAFDTDTIALPADQPSTITFDNQDAGVQHNIAIFTDDSMTEVLFRGELVTGPVTVEYQIPALPPGEYYFHCDLHPTMSGTVSVG